MFSGIIRQTGNVKELVVDREAGRLVVAAPLFASDRAALPPGPVKPGDSISVSGVCLTIARLHEDAAVFDLASETLRRTTLGALMHGQLVNLEQSLAVGDRIDGHFVAGHVDAITTVLKRSLEGETIQFDLALPPQLQGLIAKKGSIALDGVSLTVGDISGETFSVYVVPYTAEMTTLKHWEPGKEVNLEVDLLARYVMQTLLANQKV